MTRPNPSDRGVPVLCPVCGAYWKCDHLDRPAAVQPETDSESEPNRGGRLPDPEKVIRLKDRVTIDGVWLEEP